MSLLVKSIGTGLFDRNEIKPLALELCGDTCSHYLNESSAVMNAKVPHREKLSTGTADV